jgi:hypothetical protein
LGSKLSLSLRNECHATCGPTKMWSLCPSRVNKMELCSRIQTRSRTFWKQVAVRQHARRTFFALLSEEALFRENHPKLRSLLAVGRVLSKYLIQYTLVERNITVSHVGFQGATTKTLYSRPAVFIVTRRTRPRC